MNEMSGLRSLPDIVGDLAHDAGELLRGEIRLARVELDRKLEAALLALVWTFGGMFVAFAGLVVLLLAGVSALAYVIPAWAAALVVGIVIAAIGGIAIAAGIRMLAPSNLVPQRTLRNLGRDAHVVKEHI